MSQSNQWTVVVPIRALQGGKTRLVGFPDAAALTEAFCRDLLAACPACPRVRETIVVSSDPEVLALASSLRARTHAEAAADGINEAIDRVRSSLPPQEPVAVILGDTPCIDATVLDEVLAAADTADVSFVPDTAGTGTTIWCSRNPDARPHFGPHSRAHHRQAGAVELGSDHRDALWARARRDVDTAVDLWDAIRLGVGPATERIAG